MKRFRLHIIAISLTIIVSQILPILCSAYSAENIYMSVLQPDVSDVPEEANNQLELKLKQLLMQNGVNDENPYSRFVITSRVSIISKDIVAGPPTKVSMNIDFTFIVGDIVENKQFESYTMSTIGVGANENKAFISAIKNIKPRNPGIVSFLEKAKDEVIAYYSQKCESIKLEAEREASARNYERAIYLLTQIPDICDCAYECQSLAIQYSSDFVNNRAASLLNEAKAAWAACPNADGANNVANIITEIPANSSSQIEVDKLISEINTKLKADEKRKWDFELKKYNDRIEKQKRDDQARLEQQRADNIYRDKLQDADNKYQAAQQDADNRYRAERLRADNAFRSQQQQANNEARKQAIEAARQIGVAYAKNQSKSVPYRRTENLWE